MYYAKVLIRWFPYYLKPHLPRYPQVFEAQPATKLPEAGPRRRWYTAVSTYLPLARAQRQLGCRNTWVLRCTEKSSGITRIPSRVRGLHKYVSDCAVDSQARRANFRTKTRHEGLLTECHNEVLPRDSPFPHD
jgi:hypothetical protein